MPKKTIDIPELMPNKTIDVQVEGGQDAVHASCLITDLLSQVCPDQRAACMSLHLELQNVGDGSNLPNDVNEYIISNGKIYTKDSYLHEKALLVLDKKIEDQISESEFQVDRIKSEIEFAKEQLAVAERNGFKSADKWRGKIKELNRLLSDMFSDDCVFASVAKKRASIQRKFVSVCKDDKNGQYRAYGSFIIKRNKKFYGAVRNEYGNIRLICVEENWEPAENDYFDLGFCDPA